MNRRNFISGLSKSGLAVAAVSMATATAVKGRELIDHSADEVSGRVDALRKRVDALEKDQKNYLKVLCVVVAVSTGIDLSVLM